MTISIVPSVDRLSRSPSPEQPSGAEGRVVHDQQNRRRMIRVSASNYALCALGLACYGAAGAVGWEAPLLYLAVTMAGSAVFFAVVKSGLNLRLREPNMFMVQMLFAGLVLLGFLWRYPHLTVVFLCNLFVTAMFGVMQFNMRQFVTACAFIAVGTAVVFTQVAGRIALPASTPMEVALLWVYLMIGVLRFSVVGAHVGTLRRKLREKNELLQQSLARAQELADHDELTGVLNRRRFLQLAEEECLRAERSGEPFSLALLDIDHFKAVNDRFGHLIGDAVLKAFCDALGTELRATDRLGRYGGEEFIVLMPNTWADTAPVAAERMREAVKRHPWEQAAPGLAVTMSIGVAVYQPGESLKEALDRADRALYEAKGSGRDRVVVAA